MLFKILSRLRTNTSISNARFNILKRNIKDISFYEPPYLESNKPKFPQYEALTVQIKGYDYPVLENFQKYAHIIATYMDIPVDHCWAHPAKHFEVQRYKTRSTNIETTYKIIIYERNLKIVQVDSSILPLYIEALQAALPGGSKLSIFHYDPEHEKDKYVPDHDLISKMKELNELGGPPEDVSRPLK